MARSRIWDRLGPGSPAWAACARSHPEKLILMPVSAIVRTLPGGTGERDALSVLNSVFGLPAFRGAQQEIVKHVTGGGNCLVLMPTGADIEAILQHAHSLGAVIDVSNQETSAI